MKISPYVYPAIARIEKELTDHEKAQIIIDTVCKVYDFPFDVVAKNVRTREFVEARQVIMHICLRKTKLTLKQVAKLFIQRGRPYDHSTVIHARKHIDGFLFYDREFSEKYDSIIDKINEAKLISL